MTDGADGTTSAAEERCGVTVGGADQVMAADGGDGDVDETRKVVLDLSDDDTFRDLLDLLMVADDTTLRDDGNSVDGRLVNEVESEAKRRGYTGWVDAYHAFEPAAGGDGDGA